MKKNIARTVSYYCYGASGPLINDATNHTLSVVADGTRLDVAASPDEIDATLLPGIYSIALSANENSGSVMLLGGKTTTASSFIAPVQWTNEVNVEDIEDSTVLAKEATSNSIFTIVNDFTSGGGGGVTIEEIEASTVIAKQATVSAIEVAVGNKLVNKRT